MAISNNLGELEFTVFTNTQTGRYLTKQYNLVDNSIEKTAAANMIQGTATRVTCDFQQFGQYLEMADHQIAFGYGVHDLQYGTTVNIVTQHKVNVSRNQIARSKAYYDYAANPGILMLDHDPSEYGRTLTAQELLAILAQIHPAIQNVAKIIKPSMSASVVKRGEIPVSSSGFHIYIPVQDASDIPRYGKLLYETLWLNGHGFMALARNGKKLERTSIDAAVFSPERLDFVGQPVINSDQLEYCPPAIEYIKGEYLDTRSLADLTIPERNSIQSIKERAQAASDYHANLKRESYRQETIDDMVSAEVVAQDDAVRVVDAMLNSIHHELYGPCQLTFTDPTLGTVTVNDILNYPAKYDGQSLADPIEGIGAGRNKAMLFWNEGRTPKIHSFVHGGIVYTLRRAVLTLKRSGQYDTTLSNLETGFKDLLDGWVVFDVFKDTLMVEYRDHPLTVLNDISLTKLRKAYESQNFPTPQVSDIQAMLEALGAEHTMNSAKTGLEALQWDGIPRIEHFFRDYFGADNNDYISAVSRYTWTAIAGRILDPGCQADMLPIIMGQQGVGKSQGVKAMALNSDHYAEISLGSNDDDNARMMRGRIIIEISELRGLNTKDSDHIKAFITRSTDSWIPKYKEYTTDNKRQCLFIATTNETQFLSDTTGNRRYLPLVARHVKVSAIKHDIEQLYAEACHDFKLNGIAWENAERLARDELAQHMMRDPWEQTVLAFVNGDNHHKVHGIEISKILEYALLIDVKHQTPANVKRVAGILKNDGWNVKQKRKNGGQRMSMWSKI
jgi:hypothetical protein